MSDETAATPESLVAAFYHEVWNQADERRAYDILDPDFRFRGSIGLEKIGIAGFIEYMRAIHLALRDYVCVIETLLVEGDSAAARMTFRGTHVAPFLGVAATHRDISWAGAAFFTFRRGRIATLWVLGDIDAIKRQLAAGTTGHPG